MLHSLKYNCNFIWFVNYGIQKKVFLLSQIFIKPIFFPATVHFEQYMVGLACFYLHMGDVSGCPISKAPKFNMNLLQFDWNVPYVKVNAEWVRK